MMPKSGNGGGGGEVKKNYHIESFTLQNLCERGGTDVWKKGAQANFLRFASHLKNGTNKAIILKY